MQMPFLTALKFLLYAEIVRCRWRGGIDFVPGYFEELVIVLARLVDIFEGSYGRVGRPLIAEKILVDADPSGVMGFDPLVDHRKDPDEFIGNHRCGYP